jgi:hypothetical protein
MWTIILLLLLSNDSNLLLTESTVSDHETVKGLNKISQLLEASVEFNSDTIYYTRSICEASCPVIESEYNCICICYTKTNKLVSVSSKYNIKLVSGLEDHWDEIQMTSKEKAECNL